MVTLWSFDVRVSQLGVTWGRWMPAEPGTEWGRKDFSSKGTFPCRESRCGHVFVDDVIVGQPGQTVSEAPVHGSELMVRLILSGCLSEAVLAKKGSLLETGRQKSVRTHTILQPCCSLGQAGLCLSLAIESTLSRLKHSVQVKALGPVENYRVQTVSIRRMWH